MLLSIRVYEIFTRKKKHFFTNAYRLFKTAKWVRLEADKVEKVIISFVNEDILDGRIIDIFLKAPGCLLFCSWNLWSKITGIICKMKTNSVATYKFNAVSSIAVALFTEQLETVNSLIYSSKKHVTCIIALIVSDSFKPLYEQNFNTLL